MSIIRQVCKLKYNVIGKNYMLRKPNEKEVKSVGILPSQKNNIILNTKPKPKKKLTRP